MPDMPDHPDRRDPEQYGTTVKHHSSLGVAPYCNPLWECIFMQYSPLTQSAQQSAFLCTTRGGAHTLIGYVGFSLGGTILVTLGSSDDAIFLARYLRTHTGNRNRSRNS